MDTLKARIAGVAAALIIAGGSLAAGLAGSATVNGDDVSIRPLKDRVQVDTIQSEVRGMIIPT